MKKARKPFSFFFWPASLGFLFICGGRAQAQDAVRMSLAGEEAAELQKKSTEAGYYNLKVGPVDVRLFSQLEIGLVDNVNFTENNRESDMYFRPNVNVAAFWPVTPGNSLILSTDIGYTKYVKTTSNDHLDISPNSALTFRVYTGDFVINFHERFSVSQDVSATPTVGGTGNINLLENVTGVGVDWDLNKLVLSLSYDHDWVQYPGSIYDYSDNNSDLFNAKAAYSLNPTTTAGLESGTGLTYYTQHALSDNVHFSLGAFYKTKLTENLQFKATFGGIYYSFSTNSTTAATTGSDAKGWYGDVGLSHTVNQWFDHSLTGGRQFAVATATDLLDLYYLRYQANWHYFRQVPVSAHLFFEKGKSYGGATESFDRYGAGLSVNYLITRKLTSSAKYDFLDKNSDIAGNDYVENQLVLDLTYSF